jgi:hypothetical protein
MEIDTETDMEMDVETDNTQTWTWMRKRTWTCTCNWDILAKYLTWHNIRDGFVRTASDMPWRNFQQRYIIVAPLQDKKNDIRYKKFIPLLELLSKQCVSRIRHISMGLKKGRYQRYV